MQHVCNKIAVNAPLARDTPLFKQKLQIFSIKAFPQDRAICLTKTFLCCVYATRKRLLSKPCQRVRSLQDSVPDN